ncbi:MAG: MFS transporter [Bacteroidales bacterium]
MKKEKIFGIEKNVFFIGVTSFFNDTSIKMVYSVMPLFLLSIGASKTAISAIEGLSESIASFVKVLSGFWSDKLGRYKPFLVIGYTLSTLVTPFYAISKFAAEIMTLRIFERFGKGLRAAPRDSMIGQATGDNDSGKNFGFHKAMDNSGAVLGPLIAMALLYYFPDNYQLIFIIASIPALFGVLTIVLYIKENSIKKVEHSLAGAVNKIPQRFYCFLIIVFVFSLGNSTDALLLVKTSETGISHSLIPLVFMLYNTVSVILAVPIGKLSDKIGHGKMIVIGFFLYSIIYFIFGYSSHFGVFLLLFALYGIYSAMTDSSQKAMISDIVPHEIKGTAFGLYHAVLGITFLPASLFAGLLYDYVNSSAPFYFGGALSLIAALLMLLFLKTEGRCRIS